MAVMHALGRAASAWVVAGAPALPVPATPATPSQPIRLIVPLPPGGMGDTQGRAIAAKLAQAMNVPVIVENKPGASTVIATMEVVRAPADGQTLLFTFSATAITNLLLMSKLPYNAERELTPIVLIAKSGTILIAGMKTPFDNMPQLIDHARRNPGKLSCGSTGPGTISHLSCEILKERAGIDITHVPFKGSADANAALLGGHIDLLFDAPLGALQAAKSGKAKVLGIADVQRYAVAPGVPTMAKQGIAGAEILGGFMVFGPARMPADVVERLNRDFAKAIRDPEVNKLLVDNAQIANGGSPEEMRAFIKEQSQRIAEFARRTGFKLDP